MSRGTWKASVCRLATCLALFSAVAFAAESQDAGQSIDLPTALRLAGAQNLDVAIARERLAEARAAQERAREQFFPWLSPGATYRRHDGKIQRVEGVIIDASKQSYDAGATLAAQADLGDAYFETLAARQLVSAAGHALDAQRDDAVLAAAQRYFDLVRAQAAAGVAREAVRISRDYEDQLHRAVAIGIAFKGEELRVRVETERTRLTLRRAEEERRVAAARLAETLHIDPAVDLVARDGDLVPLSLPRTDAPLDVLVGQALAARPELRESRSLVAAAEHAKTGAVYGPMIPTLGAQVSAGGLGGGVDGDTGHFGDSEDYVAGLSWRIGPGGLFDLGRIHAAEARLRGSELSDAKLKDRVARQVVEAHARIRSLADQLETATRALAAAEESLRLTRERKEFAVGNVLESIQAEQELTRTRNDYFAAIAEYDKAQYALQNAVGAPPTAAAEAMPPPE